MYCFNFLRTLIVDFMFQIRKTNTGEHSKLLNRILVQFLLNDATMVNLGNEKAIQVGISETCN